MRRSRSSPARAGEAAGQTTSWAAQQPVVDSALRVLFERAGVGMALVDLSGRFVRVNPKYCEITGYDEAELLKLRIPDVTHPDDREADREGTARLRQGEIPVYSVEKRYVRKDGRTIWVRVDATMLYDEAGQPLGGTAIIRDITGERNAQEALRESERAAEADKTALLEIARDITGTLDLGEILERVQRRTAELLPCDVVVTFYWDPERQGFRLVSEYGGTPEQVREVSNLTFVPGAVFGGRLSGGEAVVINDAASQSGAPFNLLSRFGFNALAAAPLLVRGRVLGTFFAFCTGEQIFSPGQVALLENIARQLASAIETSDLYEEQRRETQVAAALARVGQELIAAVDTPVLLERLCQLTAEVLPCDVSYTILRQPEDDGYVPVAGHGHAADEWEAIRILRLPAEALSGLLEALRQSEVVQVDMAAPPTPWAGIPARYGVTRALYVPLRQAGQVVGVQLAACRGRQEPFDRQQERIAIGIGQLASVALANARLVEKLERANRIKLDFVNTISHELRTPLHIIIGYNDLLLQDSLGALNTEQREGVERVKNQAVELASLIEATLDLRRFDAHRVPLEMSDVPVAELIAELDAETRSLWIDGPVPVVFETAPGLGTVHTDRAKLKSVLKHLVANAVKFTDSGRVTVQTSAVRGGVEFAISDTGVGIPPDLLPAIFEPFSLGDASLTRRHRGVGLGLYVVRRLLDVLGGRIDVESTPDVGSTFRAWIPTAPVPVARSL